MLTRALDEIIHATQSLPDHLIAARRHYGHSPEAVAALRRLQDALMEVDAAVLRRQVVSEIAGFRRPLLLP